MAKSKEIKFAGSTLELEALIGESFSGRVVLGGDLVLYSETPLLASGLLTEYSRQPDRHLGSLFSKGKLSVWVSRKALGILTGSKIKTVLAIDYWLAWGKARKEKEFFLLGGIPSEQELLIATLHFKRGEVVEISEKTLAYVTAARLNSEISPLLEKIRNEHPGIPVFWAAPLPELPETGICRPDLSVYEKSWGKALVLDSTNATVSKYGLPVVLCALGTLIFGGLTGFPYYQYKKAYSQYEEESASFKSELAYASDRLRLMQERRTFIDGQGKVAEPKLKQVSRAIGAIGDLGFQSKEVKLFLVKEFKAGDSPIPDMQATIIVPKKEETAVEDAKPILTELSAKTGYSFRLLNQQGYREDKEATRALKLEGDFK